MHAMPFAAPADNPFDWPVFGLQDDVRPALSAAMAGGRASVLATLYAVEGGAPRGVGAQMLFVGEAISGFLSGGCVEADVAHHARAVLREGGWRRLVYGEGGPSDIQLPCGARIDVLLERIAPDDAAARRLLQLTGARRPAIWLTTGAARACVEAGGEDALPPSLNAVALNAVALNPAVEADPARDGVAEPLLVRRPYAPPWRLVVVGADPIALAVVRLGVQMGLETVLIRPKGPEAPPPAPVRYLRADVEAALAEVAPDPWTAVAVLTHDLDQEHRALNTALQTGAGYIGALGSRRRIPQRNARLRRDGASPDAIARLHAPIGLPIGGKSPWEIAVAILSEIVAERGLAAA
jgi:xanthine dehydrogenase accessory factor